MTKPLNLLEEKIGFIFTDKNLLNQALTHRSFLNESKGDRLNSNERLEFLGDAILELWTSENLYKTFPNLREGDLTNLRALIVRTENLASVAQTINLGDFILLSHGEESHGGRLNQSILADTFESVIGAIYLDQGNQAAFKFLNDTLSSSIDQLSSQKDYKDPKSLFQEIAQAQKGITPHYETLEETGPDHQKHFKVGVYINTDLIATGDGNSKQRAEEDAAIKAAKKLKNAV